MLDKKLLTKRDINVLAELPSKEVLLGRLVSVMAAGTGHRSLPF